jgi:hypothetical protein
MNSHELHSEIEHWTISKTSWDEGICQLCDIKKDGKHFILECLAHTHIKS